MFNNSQITDSSLLRWYMKNNFYTHDVYEYCICLGLFLFQIYTYYFMHNFIV